MKKENLIWLYMICFAIAPAILLAYVIEPRYHILIKPRYGSSAFGRVYLSTPKPEECFFLAVLFAVLFFGIVLAVWRTVNRPKQRDEEKKIMKGDEK